MQQIGRYQVFEELGRGAMGVVYRALDPAIGRPVAIKTIRLRDITDATERERLRERLFREAQSAGQLSHPGIVTIYDVGEQQEVTYVAMEYVDGTTLEKLMSGDRALAPERIIDILRQTAVALDFAHKKGIVHRDIKPANIMVNQDGTAKITDFGVAKLTDSQQMTHAGTVVGTPNYMAPEQVEGKRVDGRTDQFALGVIAYELLTGEKPFPGEHLTSVLYKIVSEEPAPPHNINATLPWAASMVIARALSKDASKRYPSATEFVNALEAALKNRKGWKPLPRGASQALPTAIAVAKPAGREEDAPRLPLPPPEREGGGMFWKTVGAAFAGIVVVAALFFGAQRWFAPEEPAVGMTEAVPEAGGPKPAPMPPAITTPARPPAAAEGAGTSPVQEPGEAQPAQQAPETAGQEPAKPAQQEAAGAAQQQSALKTPEPAKPEPRPPRPAAAAPGTATAPVREPAPARTRTRPAEAEPADDSVYVLQIITNPPGAAILVDREKTCTAPCELQLPAGRHTLVATMDGYGRELRIVELRRPLEIFVNMSPSTGTIRVESKPPGAQILVNNQVRSETTPATLVLPPGNYRVTVIKDGRRADQDILVRAGALVRYELDLNP